MVPFDSRCGRASARDGRLRPCGGRVRKTKRPPVHVEPDGGEPGRAAYCMCVFCSVAPQPFQSGRVKDLTSARHAPHANGRR